MESGEHGILSIRIMLRKSGEQTSSRYLLYRLEFCMFWSSFIMGQGESFRLQSLIRHINSGSRNSSAMPTPYDRVPKYIVHDNDLWSSPERSRCESIDLGLGN